MNGDIGVVADSSVRWNFKITSHPKQKQGRLCQWSFRLFEGEFKYIHPGAHKISPAAQPAQHFE